MRSKVKFFRTLSPLGYTYNLTPLDFIKIQFYKFCGYGRRCLRFLKRELLSSRDIWLTTIFLFFCCTGIIAIGIFWKKYQNWADGLWDMKSTFITTTGIGFFTLILRDSENWRTSLRIQFRLRQEFDWQSADFFQKFEESAGCTSSNAHDNLDNYRMIADNPDAELTTGFDTVGIIFVRGVLSEYRQKLADLMMTIDRSQLAVRQSSISFDCRELIRSIDKSVEDISSLPPSTVSDIFEIHQGMQSRVHGILLTLRLPWLWDVKRDNKIKETLLHSILTVPQDFDLDAMNEIQSKLQKIELLG